MHMHMLSGACCRALQHAECRVSLAAVVQLQARSCTAAEKVQVHAGRCWISSRFF